MTKNIQDICLSDYHENGFPKLDIPRGTKLVIPAGTTVHSSNPSKKVYTLNKKQTITVHHTLSGIYVSVGEVLNDYRDSLEKQGYDLSLLEEWKENNQPEYYRTLIRVSEPVVCWVGTGGYWCEVPYSLCTGV